MTTEEVRGLLDGGKLSGWDAGRLYIADSIEVDHDRPALLTHKEFRRLGELPWEEKKMYERLEFCYRLIAMTLRDAQVVGQGVNISILGATTGLHLTWITATLVDVQHTTKEPVTTQKVEHALQVLGADQVGLEDLMPRFRAELRDIRAGIRDYEAYVAVMAEVSTLIRVDLDQELLEWRGFMDRDATAYNKERHLVSREYRAPALRMADLNPSRRRVRELRERMVLALGEGWWKGE